MRQTQKKKEKDKTAIVLALCFSVMALTSIFVVKANIDKINENATNVLVSEEAKTEQDESTAPDTEEDKEKETLSSTEASSHIPTVDSLTKDENTTKYVSPVQDPNATVTSPFSMDKLIYSVTLDQYMTHCGIDIEAPEDCQVLAIEEGTVTSIYNDDRYGTSIEITHPDKIVSIYSNLSTAEMVEVGDVVKKGQIIGGVGSTGLFESLEPSHLHFEIIKDGAYVNPEEYVSF